MKIYEQNFATNISTKFGRNIRKQKYQKKFKQNYQKKSQDNFCKNVRTKILSNSFLNQFYFTNMYRKLCIKNRKREK